MPMVPPVYKTNTLASRTCFVIVVLSMIFQETQNSYSLFTLRHRPAKAEGSWKVTSRVSRGRLLWMFCWVLILYVHVPRSCRWNFVAVFVVVIFYFWKISIDNWKRTLTKLDNRSIKISAKSFAIQWVVPISMQEMTREGADWWACWGSSTDCWLPGNCFTITAEILTRSLINFHRQHADRHWQTREFIIYAILKAREDTF